MAASKGILTKIRSIQNMQKITRAMQMVSTSKMRKTQERMGMARPYAEKVRTVMAHLSLANTDIRLPLLEPHDQVRRVGIILITTDKGLCGGLNVNLIKRFFHQVRIWHEEGVDVDACCLGTKGLVACRKAGIHVVASATQLGDVPAMDRLIGPATLMFQKYTNHELDAVYLLYSRFIHAMKQEATLEKIIPLTRDHMAIGQGYAWDYLYEPDALSVLQFLVQRYIESVIYQAIVENMASEQAARMVAMKSATDNANDAIKRLSLVYNKSRQAAITTELSEIVAGASAV